MDGRKREPVIAAARDSQWTVLQEAVEKIADVLLCGTAARLTDMVFTVNAGLVYDGSAALSSLYHPSVSERAAFSPQVRGVGHCLRMQSVLLSGR